MSDYNYNKHITGATTYHEGSFIECHDADISAIGEGIAAPTFTAKGFTCDTSATVVSENSATVVIDQLNTNTATLTVKNSATLRIREINVDTVKISVEYKSTLMIDSGSIGTISGIVKKSSTGRCKATIKEKDNVTAQDSSTWDA